MKTTRKQFELFKNSFKKTQEAFGLIEYDILFQLKNTGPNYASICVEYPSMVGTVDLADDYDKDVEFDPVSLGVHEAIHLLIYEMDYLANNRYSTEESIDIANERLTRKIQESSPIQKFISSLKQ